LRIADRGLVSVFTVQSKNPQSKFRNPQSAIQNPQFAMRRANRLPLEELAPYLLEVPPLPQALIWREVFGNGNVVEIEVGFGKGLFLLTSAQANPDVNYLGIEIVRKYQLFTATRMAKRGLKNVRLARADARLFLRDYVPAASVRAVHVYFPDPWWKKRHKKRRVFTAEFARECERVLRAGGRLHVATDVEEYFGVMNELLTQETRLRRLTSPEPAAREDYLTNFERKSRIQGLPVYRSEWEKEGAQATAPAPMQ
jgi:tRNA (guanine-N7-)-methyltransferase